jgi:hypothetical protein
MTPRGSRFARGKEPSRDAQGHSLPSDVFTQYVAIDLVCKPCGLTDGKIIRLARFAVETRSPEFSPNQVGPRGENPSLTIQEIANPDGSVRRRYKMTCPICRHSPVVRGERVDHWLEELYLPGAQEQVEMRPV